MAIKVFKFRGLFLLAVYAVLSSVCCDTSFGQTAASVAGADPIVDPLSEMSPSPEGETNDSILHMDIDQLTQVDAVVPAFDIEVSSVSKQESTIGKSPAAVFVITNEMIQRSGATCIPEVLRMAPGVEVARINSNAWAVSIRGFCDRYCNKLLVMVDGRSVYSPILSGTFWDMIDMPLEDIERIEIIRGPGGTIWGANAVNGIINIINKSSRDTQGTLISTGGGSQDYNINTVRYGGKLGKNATFRVWGKYRDVGPEDSPGKYDSWWNGRGGFHADWNPGGSRDDLITVEGNFYGGEEGVRFNLIETKYPSPSVVDSIGRRHVSENSVQARWTHTIDDETDWSIQSYFDQTCRYGPQAAFTINTFDVEFQYRRPFGDRHQVIAGVEYNRSHDFTSNPSASLQFVPASRAYDTISCFIQDEIEIVDDKFYLTAGSKFEGNTFSGFEYQPSVRALWVLDDRHVVWGAVSRAVRTPNRFDENMLSYRYMQSYGSDDYYARLTGSTNLNSEEVIAYELGYRAQTTERFSWDIALFCNKYRQLMAYDKSDWEQEGHNHFYPHFLANLGNGETYGFEWTASWEATENWTLGGSYSFLFYDARYIGNSVPPLPDVGGAFNDPHNQVRLQSYWNFAPHWQLDCFLRYVDYIENRDTPNYITMDARLGWKANKNLEFSIVGQNLFSPHHEEFNVYDQYAEPAVCLINRAVFAKMTWTR